MLVNQGADSEAELANYKAMTVPAAAPDPLTFWKQHEHDYPIMSMTARRILCMISASSAQSERDFSSVRRTVTEMRSRLSADKVEATELVLAGIRLDLF